MEIVGVKEQILLWNKPIPPLTFLQKHFTAGNTKATPTSIIVWMDRQSDKDRWAGRGHVEFKIKWNEAQEEGACSQVQKQKHMKGLSGGVCCRK